MSTSAILTSVITLLSISVLIVLTIILNKRKLMAKEEKIRKIKKANIDDLLAIVSSPVSSRDDLAYALDVLIKNLPFPARENNLPVDDEQKKYLNFIFYLVAHRSADAKLIAYMDWELKSQNPSYKKEIEIYGNKGLDQRRYKKV